MKTTSDNLSDQIRKAIADSGLTRYAISKATGVGQDILSRFMTGKGGLTLDTLEKLAGPLGIKIIIGKPTIKPTSRHRKAR
ncbi:MAG: helix-turn-helix transcriptional regulator [Phycisphaerae bacterium]|nr:helix-turn-helix transcriptional regulator [Phycisphaerae bacterium]